MKHEDTAVITEKNIRLFLSIKQVATHLNPGIILLKIKLTILKNQFNSFENKKIEIDKLLSDFHHRYFEELGDILLEILRIRKIIFQSDKTKFEEAERDEREYSEQVKANRKKKRLQLSDSEKKELKKKFRMASVLCHPDKVNEKNKDEAQEIFIRLKEAYDSNDLKKVTEILSFLENGNYFKSRSVSVSKKEFLKLEIKKLHDLIQSMKNEILWIKKNTDYKKVASIHNWDSYFKDMKEKLETELEEMKKQINISTNSEE